MLMKVQAGEKPGTPKIVSDEAFKRVCYAHTGTTEFVKHEEALHWLGVGRIGSRWQMGNIIYIKVKDENDDVFQYYKPPVKTYANSPTWSCVSDKDCCGSGDCEPSGCSGGSCGGKP